MRDMAESTTAAPPASDGRSEDWVPLVRKALARMEDGAIAFANGVFETGRSSGPE